MKKIGFALALILVLATLLCGCDGFVRSYSATMLVTSSIGDEGSMEFKTFNGTYSLSLRRDEDFPEHTIDCEASLTEGEMNVYIGVDGEKELLFTIKGGERIDTTIPLEGKYDNEKKVSIILESVGKCVGGDFEFEYN